MKKSKIIILFFLIISASIFGFEDQKDLKIDKSQDVLSYSFINVVNKKIEQPLSVIVTDQNNRPIRGVKVTFDIVSSKSDDYIIENVNVLTDEN